MRRRSQIGLRTTLLAVAAAATNLAAASLLLKAPFLGRAPAVLFVVCLFAVGVILPALWIGAARRLGHDAFLGHLAVVGLLVFLFLSSASAGQLWGVALAYFLAAVGAPSILWYFVRGMEAGEARKRAGRIATAFTKGTAQLALGFAVWLLCFIVLRQMVG